MSVPNLAVAAIASAALPLSISYDFSLQATPYDFICEGQL